MIGAIILAFRYMNGSHGNAGGTSIDASEPIVKNSQLKKLSGTGLQKVAENDRLIVSIDFKDGNIEVVNKQSGYVWRSRPTDAELAKEKSNRLWKDTISSPIVFSYVNDLNSANPSIGNVANQKTKISIYQLDHGARVFFTFAKSGVRIAYDVTLKDDQLSVSLPWYLIREPGVTYIKNKLGANKVDKGKTVLLTDISVFPFLGATRNDMGDDGYLFVPDGPGALIKFGSNNGLNSQFIGTVYGEDLTYLNNYDKTLINAMQQSKVLYPVFGIVREHNSLTSIIDKGDTNADIIGSPAGVQTGFNTVNARFTYRKKYKVITSPTDGNGYFRYEDKGIRLSRSVDYFFGSGDQASYVGMAKTYRNYLMQSKGLKKQEGSAVVPLQLNIYGGTTLNTFTGQSFVSMTSFRQAEQIVDYFKEHGINNADIVYEGWGSKGDPVGQPYRFPPASDLGGNAGLTDFVKHAHNAGYNVYLEDNSTVANSRKGISLGKDAVTDVLGNPFDFGYLDDHSYLLNSKKMMKSINSNISKYKKLGIDGISENGIGMMMNTDFSKSGYVSRAQTEVNYAKALDAQRAPFKQVRIANAAAFALANKTTIEYMPTDGSYLTVLDETVPFYQIALHGLVPYVLGNYNTFSEPAVQLLKGIELGGNVSFTVTAEPTQRLKNSDNSYFYSTEFNVWKDTIVSEYKRVENVLNAVNGQFMTDYRQLAPDVTVMSYENGVKVVCNYTDQPFSYEGKTVQPKDFILVKGS